MKLISQPREDNEAAVNDLYLHIKQCIFYLETRSVVSLRLLQAILLLALYEIGHAIYPAAYLSVAHCVRFGHALNLQDLRSPYRLNTLERQFLGLRQ